MKGCLPGGAISSLHKSLMYIELGIHHFHIFSFLVNLNWLQVPHGSLHRDVACVGGFILI